MTDIQALSASKHVPWNKGKIVVEFASLDDLQRIVATMSPNWAQSLTA